LPDLIFILTPLYKRTIRGGGALTAPSGAVLTTAPLISSPLHSQTSAAQLIADDGELPGTITSPYIGWATNNKFFEFHRALRSRAIITASLWTGEA